MGLMNATPRTAKPPVSPLWISLPVDDGHLVPRLGDGDSYLVRLASGSVVWAVFVVHHGARFERLNADGDDSTGEVLDGVEAVMVRGYGPGVAEAIIAAAQEALSIFVCSACSAECFAKEVHAAHKGMCRECGEDLQVTLSAERAEALLSDAEIVEALLDDTEPAFSAERDQRVAS